MRIFCAAWLPWMRGYVGGGATSAREAHDENLGAGISLQRSGCAAELAGESVGRLGKKTLLASAVWTWHHRNSVTVSCFLNHFCVFFIKFCWATRRTLVCLLTLGNVVQFLLLRHSVCFYKQVYVFVKCPFSLSSQRFWVCRTKLGCWTLPDGWWTWDCLWSPPVAPRKPCVMLDWLSGGSTSC